MTALDIEHNLTVTRLYINECVNGQRTEIVTEIFAAVQLFCGDAQQSDDRTVVVIKINQLGPAAKADP